MPAEDSSSANVNPRILLCGAEPLGAGVLKITLDASGARSPQDTTPSHAEGVAVFTKGFLRREYLFPVPGKLRVFIESLFDGESVCPEEGTPFCGTSCLPYPLSEDDFNAVVFSSRIFGAESAAMKYLSAAEHSRFQLEVKLRKKGFSSMEIKPALDFLCAGKIIDDRRFASAWLNSRLSSCINGRIKLSAELASRGVSREDACAALNEFFSVHSEEELCRKAAEKLRRMGRSGGKLAASLSYRGFPAQVVRKCLSDEKEK